MPKHYKNRVIKIRDRFYTNLQPVWTRNRRRFFCLNCGGSIHNNSEIQRSDSHTFHCNVCNEALTLKGRDKVPTEMLTGTDVKCEECNKGRYLDNEAGKLFCPVCDNEM